ncbi:MAG: DUF5615 family PIN-like protein [Bryobacteraceae bacterium]
MTKTCRTTWAICSNRWVTRSRGYAHVLPTDTADEVILQFAYESDCFLVTCNRDDFIRLAAAVPHHGVVIVIRRQTRADERAALLRLLERAGETGLRNNINFS